MAEKLIGNVVVALDGSELGERAVEHAAVLAKGLDARIHLVSVAGHGNEKEGRVLESYLEGIVAGSLKGVGMKKVTTAVIGPGEAASAILTYAEAAGDAMIVMMSHGRSGVLRWAMGGTASKVFQNSRVPVLMARANGARAPAARLFKSILVPLDGSALGEGALPYVKELAGTFDSRVVLVRVVETMEHLHTFGHADHFMFTQQQVDSMQKEAEEYLAETGKKIGDGRVKTVVAMGDPASEILRVADEERVNLVAMSSHGKSGMMRWVMGSVSRKILDAGKTPIMLVPAKRPE